LFITKQIKRVYILNTISLYSFYIILKRKEKKNEKNIKKIKKVFTIKMHSVKRNKKRNRLLLYYLK